MNIIKVSIHAISVILVTQLVRQKSKACSQDQIICTCLTALSLRVVLELLDEHDQGQLICHAIRQTKASNKNKTTARKPQGVVTQGNSRAS